MSTIQDIRNVHTPQRAYEWEVSITGNHNQVLLVERAKSVSIPETSIDTIIINYKSRKAHYAGRSASPSTVTVVFWDDEASTVYKFFKKWLEDITDSEKGGGETADKYTSEMHIKLLKHDSAAESTSHRLTRVFPTSVGDVQLSYDQSEHLEVSVTFSFDSNLQA